MLLLLVIMMTLGPTWRSTRPLISLKISSTAFLKLIERARSISPYPCPSAANISAVGLCRACSMLSTRLTPIRTYYLDTRFTTHSLTHRYVYSCNKIIIEKSSHALVAMPSRVTMIIRSHAHWLMIIIINMPAECATIKINVP